MLCQGLLPAGCLEATAPLRGTEGRRAWLCRPLEVSGGLLNATLKTLPKSLIKFSELLGSTTFSALL